MSKLKKSTHSSPHHASLYNVYNIFPVGAPPTKKINIKPFSADFYCSCACFLDSKSPVDTFDFSSMETL